MINLDFRMKSIYKEMKRISIVDSILKGLYKLGDICLEHQKQTYSKERISEYGKDHGFSDEHIERVYTKAKYDLYDAEDGLNYIKDKIDDIRDTTEELMRKSNNEDINDDYIENDNEDLRNIFYYKINSMLLVAEEFFKESFPKIIEWRDGERVVDKNLLSKLENYINKYKACYVDDETIDDTEYNLFIELNNEINRFIKVNQMLIYGIKNNQLKIVDDAINRFYNLLKNYN